MANAELRRVLRVLFNSLLQPGDVAVNAWRNELSGPFLNLGLACLLYESPGPVLVVVRFVGELWCDWSVVVR